MRCHCEECRRDRKGQTYRVRKRRWYELFASYLERWQLAREDSVEKCLADLLGYAREHTAIREVHPRHAMSSTLVGAFAGVDRSVHPTSLQWAAPCEPFSLATLREVTLRLLAYEPPPPVKPWISSARAAELEASGVRRSMIDLVFEVY